MIRGNFFVLGSGIFVTIESGILVDFEVFKMLLSKSLITERVVELIHSWAHSGFGVYCGKRICPSDRRSTENLARYIIRASFSQERMKYYPDQAKVTYQSKYGKDIKEFSCLEWMAALVSHIPDRGGQTVRYYELC